MSAQDEDTVTTIRVVNVPHYTTEADFNCWFLFAPGFEQAKLVPTRGPQQSQIGWARFATVEDANYAISYLDQRKLTEDQCPHGEVILTAEFAKGNFRPYQVAKKRSWSETSAQHPQVVVPPPRVQAPAPIKPENPPVPPAARVPDPSLRAHVAPPSTPTRVPCSTLFIAGIMPVCTEEELVESLESSFEGFERLKFQPGWGNKGGSAWAKFSTPEDAEAALHLISVGYYLPSCKDSALRAEFAKNDLGTRGSSVPPPAVVPPPPAAMRVPPPQRAAGAQYQDAKPSSTKCDTIFIGGMAPNATEEELAGVLTTLGGFIRLKFMGEGSFKPSAFALFSSAELAGDAIEALHGGALSSSPEQPLNCEFAKNSLDKRQRTV